ncbi:TfoX/Sxy family protein [Undibacterium sp.]|jgi:DNA transformation protein|uniref:TfoX/Sxy family protein n=1 Tax=Undibacterium sp. TaxID=1914977 RepID=UPI002C39E114|nr:TfoX/Sxy family protein [Undibacterium sp.]HTD03250.1 TfoX/Sxy family protein [Undibacterium sp.]
MSVSTEFTAYIKEKFELLGGVSFSRFFGGLGISYNDVQFAMVIGNTLYFCVDDNSREDYRQIGMQPFSYASKKKTILINKYYSVPEDVLDNPDSLREWAQAAIKAAHATSKKKPAR